MGESITRWPRSARSRAASSGAAKGSVGSGIRWQPTPVERIPTNVMVAVGYSTKILKLFEARPRMAEKETVIEESKPEAHA